MDRRLFAVGIATAVILAALSGISGPSLAQTAGTSSTSQVKPPGLECSTTIADPFKGKLAGPDLPKEVVLPVDETIRSDILASALPCQENVNPVGLEDTGLENLQRGFDFYSWRTFIALNSPADGSSHRKIASRTCRRGGRIWTISSSSSTSCCLPKCCRRNGRPTKAEMEAEQLSG